MRGPGRPFGLPPRIAIGFASAIAFLLATVAVTVLLERARDDEARQVTVAAQAMLALQDLEISLRIVSAAADSHLDRSAGRELALAEQAIARIDADLGRVGLLLSAGEGQRARLARLDPIARQIGRAARASLGLPASAQAGEGRPGAPPAGGEAIDQATRLLGEIEQVEEAAMQAREASWRRAAAIGAGVFIGAAVVLLALVLRAVRMVVLEIRTRERLGAELADMVEHQRQLMAIVGHDLRSPLATIHATAAFLDRARDLDPARRADARRILATARRMDRLIRDLLDVSRVRAGGGIPVQPAPADLLEICGKAIADLGAEAEERVVVCGRGDTAGEWDPGRLEQIAANLVSNALKYGPSDRPIRIEADGESGEEVRLTVHDEGGSIDPAQREEIFRPFIRGRAGDAEEQRSSGLGLFVVRRIAEAHGGRVEVDSDPARGTTFTVRLPRRAGAAPA